MQTICSQVDFELNLKAATNLQTFIDKAWHTCIRHFAKFFCGCPPWQGVENTKMKIYKINPALAGCWKHKNENLQDKPFTVKVVYNQCRYCRSKFSHIFQDKNSAKISSRKMSTFVVKFCKRIYEGVSFNYVSFNYVLIIYYVINFT